MVYAKRLFSGPGSVVEYLGRYTHKIAISNHRIKNVEDGKITFSYMDYRQGAVKKEMALEALEFIRRFAMHVLPERFCKNPPLWNRQQYFQKFCTRTNFFNNPE